jgi:alkylation response protein AidB-like acyl-CoA dehydrogenase
MALDFELSDEQQLIRTSVRKALEPFVARREELLKQVMGEKKFPHEVWLALAETGLFGCLIPEEYGGTGIGLLAMALALEEMATIGFGNALAVTTAMDATCIVRNASEELKRRFLPGIADGSIKFCFAVTEPDAGSNTFRLKTTAKRNGSAYEVSGQKTFITGANVAEQMLLVVRTTPIEEIERQGLPKAFGLSLLVVDTKSAGIELRAIPTRGIEGLTQFTVFFDKVRVPAENLVGQEGAGSMALFNSLNPERILAAATACGMTEFALQRACAYAKQRKVFKDRFIGSYQAIQHPLAEIRIQLDAVRLMTWRSAWAFDREMPPGLVGSYANMAKFLGAEMAIRAADQAIETLGGYGFSEEYHVIYLWEAARLLRTAPITKEMILNYISEHVLDLPRSY